MPRMAAANAALLRCSAPRQLISGCPMRFRFRGKNAEANLLANFWLLANYAGRCVPRRASLVFITNDDLVNAQKRLDPNACANYFEAE
jgi:hypothetical protein